MEIEFKHNQDKLYFLNLFEKTDDFGIYESFFDFREPLIKRREFGNIRNRVFESLIIERGNVCALKCHPDCSNVAEQVDHIIPLSSNELNKKLRNIKGINGKKTPAQSFGSNYYINFALACKRCNAFKKNSIPTKELLLRLLDNYT